MAAYLPAQLPILAARLLLLTPVLTPCGVLLPAARCPLPQVLHARTCTGTERQLIHLVAACHLIFSVGCDNVHLALDMLPALRPAGGGGTPKAGAGAAWALTANDSTSSLSSLAGGGGNGGGRGRPGAASRSQ